MLLLLFLFLESYAFLDTANRCDLNNEYVQNISTLGQIPDTIERMTFGYYYNQPLVNRGKNILPSGLKELELGCKFDNYQHLVLPKNLIKLKLCKYEKPIEKLELPDTLEHLEISWGFNHPLDQNSLPKNLKFFSPGFHFNQMIKNDCLPDTIQELYFGEMFDETILQLPRHLIHLGFANRGIKPFIGPGSGYGLSTHVPDGLKSLKCHDECFYNFINYCRIYKSKVDVCKNIITNYHSMKAQNQISEIIQAHGISNLHLPY